jgi:outer membrane lipoprotein-sorting protein
MASKRKQITNEIKLDILENKNKLTTTELSVKYELAPSTISTIFSNRDKIITNSKTNDNKSCKKGLDYLITPRSKRLWVHGLIKLY